MQDTMKENAKECLLDYIQARSDQFFLRLAVQSFCKKIAVANKCLVKGYKKRQVIKEKLNNSLFQVKQGMVEGITKKSSKKAKETAKLVKKLDDKHVENIREILNKVFIMRHKVRMLWFNVNKDEA